MTSDKLSWKYLDSGEPVETGDWVMLDELDDLKRHHRIVRESDIPGV